MGPRIPVLGCMVDPVTLDEAEARIARWVRRGPPRRGIAVNARKLALRRTAPAVRAEIERADLVLADGATVLWAARLAGHHLPQRVTGVDLAARLLDRAAVEGWTIALVGGRPEVARALAGPGRFTHHGYLDDPAPVVRRLQALRPHVLLVGMGSPRQERFLAAHPDLARFAMGVGGALDVLSGRAPRAPEWTRRAGLEGAWRIAREPRARWRRVLDLARITPPP